MVISAGQQMANQANGSVNYKFFRDIMYDVDAYGLKGDGTTNDTEKLQALIDLAISEEREAIYFPHGAYYVTDLTNADRVVFFGDNASFAGEYSGIINQFGRDETVKTYIEGREYMFFFHDKLRNNLAVKLVGSGDSTMYGTAITDPKWIFTTACKNYLNQMGITSVTAVNAGHEGAQTPTWTSTYIALDMAQNPDIYICEWGLNDGALPLITRLATFKTALRTGLAGIRSVKTVNQMSIILMMPNSSNDDTYHRNALWLNAIYPIVKQAARDYQCCFVDAYNYLLDSTNVIWQDTLPYHIHPLNTGNAWKASLVTSVLIPEALRNYGVTNTNSADIVKHASSAPSTYPYGLSIMRTQAGFPDDGEVTNILSYDGIAFQFNHGYQAQTVERIGIRRGFSKSGVSGSLGDDTYAPWIYIRGEIPWTNLTLLNSWVNGGGTDATAQYMLDSAGNVHIKGYVTTGTATVFAAMPVGFRPAQDRYFHVLCNGALGIIKIKASDGTINAVIILSSAWVSFGDISYKAEQ